MKNIFLFLGLLAASLVALAQPYSAPLVILYEVEPDNAQARDRVKLYFYNNLGSPFQVSAANIGIRFDNEASVPAGVSFKPALDAVDLSFKGIFGFNYQINVAEVPADAANAALYDSRWWYSNSVLPFTGGINVSLAPNSPPQHVMTVEFSRVNAGVAGNFYVETVADFAGLNFNDGVPQNLPYQAGPLAGLPFPVELLEFEAFVHGKAAARLEWVTASEINSARFEVERSFDARSFEQVGSVAAAGNASLRTEYHYIDNPVPGNIVYYRLRQVDLDGSFTYSPVRQLRFSGEEALAFRLYPVPTPGPIVLEAAVEPGGEYEVSVLDAAGRSVFRQQAAFAAGRFEMDLSALPPALYALEVRDADGEQVFVRAFEVRK